MSLSLAECHALMFRSYERVSPSLKGYDQFTRDISTTRELLQRAGISTHFAPAITVTGSKGKGSTSLLSAALLQGMGCKVGLLTSPNHIDLRERIRLNGHVIPEADYVRIINELAPHINALDASLPAGKYLSPTGMFLTVALRYFSEQQTTALVLEVGRGGRFDDVSLYDNGVSVLTPMMDEHLDKLGPSVREVAWHKSGIIKQGGLVVSAPQNATVREVLRAETQARAARLLYVGEDIHYTQTTSDDGTQQVRVNMDERAYEFDISTRAKYQALNLALACGAAASFGDLQQAQDTVRRLRFPGRCNQVSVQPSVIIDGAINREAAELFRDSVQESMTRPLLLVTALPHDKDAYGLLQTLAPLTDAVIVTRVTANHLHFNDEVVPIARQFNPDVTDEPDVDAAFRRALDVSGTQGTVWVVGTQSLVRDALRFWQQDLTSVFAQAD
ncbi:MAG: Mur ligase family protein [Anaerolineae bacterium]